jgi:hypothetical protein
LARSSPPWSHEADPTPRKPTRAKKEIFAEAKGEGFDVKVLREILRLRKQDKDERDEQESLLDLYLRAMESASSSQVKAA